jgi:hypothetical protein
MQVRILQNFKKKFLIFIYFLFIFYFFNLIANHSWSESSGTGKNRRTTRYEGREDYLHTATYLVGSREGILS